MHLKKTMILLIGLLCISTGLFAQVAQESIRVSSIKELALATSNSDCYITMEPGVYQMEDYLTPAVISNCVPDQIGRCAMITFSGNNTTYDFTGVIIEVNTKLLNDFGKRVIAFYAKGDNNHIKGLTVTDVGNFPTHKGGHSFTVAGNNNRIENVTMNVKGSSPYGYGDLLGKGKGALVPLKKHSGMCVEGSSDTIIDCSIYSKAFGHLFFVQGGRDIYFENCYAEAAIRTTDDMLAETSGPAFDANFASVYKNRKGEKVITLGYTKSLSECGFRNYGKGGVTGRSSGDITVVNCRARNTRVGFALGNWGGDILIKDCEATGCEIAYNVEGATIENSRGDAVNGPLLYVDGDSSNIELYLMPTKAITTVHAIATISDNNHVVTLKKWEGKQREQDHTIKIGVSEPMACNPFSPYRVGKASGITLNNYTGMPIEIGPTVSSSTINSNGEVNDMGIENTIITID